MDRVLRRTARVWLCARNLSGPECEVDIKLDYKAAEEFAKYKADGYRIEQRAEDAACLIAAVLYAKPKTMLEIGTSAGEGAAAILFGSREFDSHLYCVDLAVHAHYDKSKPIGSYVTAAFPDYGRRLHVQTGVRSDYVGKLGQRFDFVHIDANHSHPWAIIDLLAAVPYMNEGALVAFHDANYVAAISQAAYYLARVFPQPSKFLAHHFLYHYPGPTDEFFDAVMAVLDINWQVAVPPRYLNGWYEKMALVFKPHQAMAICGKVFERNANFHRFGNLYNEINGSLWKRELALRSRPQKNSAA